MFGVPWRFAIELAESFDLFEREIIASQVKKRIEEHGTMPTGEDETVASRPFGVARVVTQMPRPDRVSHRRRPHRESGMARVGLLNGVR